jgi:hypothetical protein
MNQVADATDAYKINYEWPTHRSTVERSTCSRGLKCIVRAAYGGIKRRPVKSVGGADGPHLLPAAFPRRKNATIMPTPRHRGSHPDCRCLPIQIAALQRPASSALQEIRASGVLALAGIAEELKPETPALIT